MSFKEIDKKCFFCDGAGEKWNSITTATWRCSPCQGTGLAKFYLSNVEKIIKKPDCGAFYLWNVGEPFRLLERK